ncbi:MAG TPA: H-X9-DG-CTERM domain-containing protein, partial [Armatimonadota bacterium]|nr:H-X9-DG-CTERM domain-containing protein [Armatimonadota bacterium]
YIRNTDIYMCPAAQVSGAKLAELPPERRHGYAINALLSPPDLRAVGGSHGTPLGLAQIESPSTTILLCDAGYSNLPVALDYSRCLSLGMQEQLLPSRRHSGGSNFCFADGHVKRLTEPATRTPDGLWSPD